MNLTLQPVRVANGFDEEGVLVFTEQQQLVAVLTRLSDQHEGMAGKWYLEAGFGRLDGAPHHPTFADLDAAQEYIAKCLSDPLWIRTYRSSYDDAPARQRAPEPNERGL